METTKDHKAVAEYILGLEAFGTDEQIVAAKNAISTLVGEENYRRVMDELYELKTAEMAF